MKTAVIIPTYNEKENLPELVARIKKIDKSLNIIVVDDNSPDGTGKLADKLARKYKGIIVVHRAAKLGLGTAYRAGFKVALKSKHDVLITMDADLSHNPTVIPSMLAKIPKYDVVIGSRHTKGGKIVGFDWFRNTLSAVAQSCSKYLLNLPTHDSTSGYRAYRAGVIKAINVETITSNGYSFLIEALYRCIKKGYKVAEVPITFYVRTKGKSKLSNKEIYNALITVFKLLSFGH